MIYSAPVILKFVGSPTEAEDGTFSGFGSTWSIDRTSERIAYGAFSKTVAALAGGAQRIPVLLEHNPHRVIGAVSSAQETDDGLEVTGKLLLGDPDTDRVHRLLMAKALGLSVGFTERPGGSSRVNGIRTFNDVDWMELSIVSVPANAQAVVHHVRSLEGMTRAEFKSALLEGSLPAVTRRMAEKMARVFSAVDDETDHDEADIAAALAAANRVKLLLTPRK